MLSLSRRLRVFVENMSQHILLSGLNGMDIFIDHQDCEIFESMLASSIINSNIKVHKVCITRREFNFLATPEKFDAIAKFIQSLARKYVAYFNKKYQRSGTIWDGRFRSTIVEDDMIFVVMKYLDQKSFQDGCISGDGLVFLTHHQMYKNLGFTDIDRLHNFSNITQNIDTEKLDFVESCLKKQIPTASIEFVKNLEKNIGMALSEGQRGRPKKQNQEEKNKMYKNLQVLDKEKHKSLKINPMNDLHFAKNMSSITVGANEVGLMGINFPVVFSADKIPSLMAILSITGENLAINSDGKWMTKYIPSTLRRYPFALASSKEDQNQKVILIDEDSDLFSKTKGKGLFNSKSEQTDVLQNATKFLTAYEQQMQITKNVAKLIADSGILEDREISVGEGDEKKVLVNGFRIVNKEKLNALSDDVLADWVRKGIISMIDSHLKSLDNIKTLFTLAQQRQK